MRVPAAAGQAIFVPKYRHHAAAGLDQTPRSEASLAEKRAAVHVAGRIGLGANVQRAAQIIGLQQRVGHLPVAIELPAAAAGGQVRPRLIQLREQRPAPVEAIERDLGRQRRRRRHDEMAIGRKLDIRIVVLELLLLQRLGQRLGALTDEIGPDRIVFAPQERGVRPGPRNFAHAVTTEAERQGNVVRHARPRRIGPRPSAGAIRHKSTTEPKNGQCRTIAWAELHRGVDCRHARQRVGHAVQRVRVRHRAQHRGAIHHLAKFGNSSQTSQPGRLEGIDPSSPRISTGAFGLGSTNSIWLGAPYRCSRMTHLARPNERGCALSLAAAASCKSHQVRPGQPGQPQPAHAQQIASREAVAKRCVVNQGRET